MRRRRSPTIRVSDFETNQSDLASDRTSRHTQSTANQLSIGTRRHSRTISIKTDREISNGTPNIVKVFPAALCAKSKVTVKSA